MKNVIKLATSEELPTVKEWLGGSEELGENGFLLVQRDEPEEGFLAVISFVSARKMLAGEVREVLAFDIRKADGWNPTADDSARCLEILIKCARELELDFLRCDFSVGEDSDTAKRLVDLGFVECQCDLMFRVSGDLVKARYREAHALLGPRIPARWRVVSLADVEAEVVYALVAEYHLMSRAEFLKSWDARSAERFEVEYSCLVMDGEVLIGALLAGREENGNLHLQVEVARKGVATMLVSALMRAELARRCPDGFPVFCFFRADSDRHKQTQNAAHRQDGELLAKRCFFAKNLSGAGF